MSTKQKTRTLGQSFLITLSFLAIMWAVFLVETTFQLPWSSYGILPRDFTGLRGLFLSPFLHGSLEHIMSNSLPFLWLGTMVFYFYPNNAWRVTFYGAIMSGLWVWVAGRSSFHIGASGLIYVYGAYLVTSGIITKNFKLMSVALVVVFMYGSMVWGVLPIQPGVSFEGHLFGAIAGIVLARYFRADNVKYYYKPKKKTISVEELEEQFGKEYWVPKPEEEQQPSIFVRYWYKKR